MMRFILSLSLSACCVLFSGAGAAPEGAELPTLVTVNGTCEQLVIGGRDVTAACRGTLLNTSYTTGRVGFYFVTSDGAALTFTGMGSSQIKPDPDTAVQPVDGVIFGFQGQFDRSKAVGICRFTNPYERPGTVSCRADAQGGAYAAEFVTDGKPPTVTRP